MVREQRLQEVRDRVLAEIGGDEADTDFFGVRHLGAAFTVSVKSTNEPLGT